MNPLEISTIFDPELPDYLLVGNRRAGKLLGLSDPTMQRQRTNGSGPPFMRISGKIFYRVGVLRAWVRDHEVKSTAQARAIRDEGI